MTAERSECLTVALKDMQRAAETEVTTVASTANWTAANLAKQWVLNTVARLDVQTAEHWVDSLVLRMVELKGFQTVVN